MADEVRLWPVLWCGATSKVLGRAEQRLLSLGCGVVQILYQARVDPAKAGKKLSDDEVSAVHKWTFEVCDVACKANADSQHFPPDWLFHHRWANKAKGVKMDDGRRPRDLTPRPLECRPWCMTACPGGCHDCRRSCCDL